MGERVVDPGSPPGASTRTPAEPTTTERQYPDRIDARLLQIGSVCLLVSVMASLDATIVAVAQRTFVVEFDSTQAIVGWTMAGYVLGLATVTPMTGWAADRFGTKRLFVASILAFTLGSLLCAIAPNILLLIIFRIVQGVAGGPLMPLTLAIMTREAGPNRLGRVMALAAIPLLLAPIGGPLLGGWLIRNYGWEWMFLINLPIGLMAVVLAAIFLPRDESEPSETFDFIGMLLLSPGVATFLYGVSEMPGRGTVTDRHVLIPLLVGLVLITAFVLHSLYRADHPLLDFRLLTNRTVGMANVAMLLYIVAGSIGLLVPSYFQQLMHLTPFEAGMHIIPSGLGAMLTMPIAGTLMDRFGPGKIVLIGLTLAVTGLGMFTYGVATQADYSPILVTALVIAGMGSGCTLLPLSGSAVLTLTEHQLARGSTLMMINQMVAGALGGALVSMILTNQFNRSENISTANEMAILQQKAAENGIPVDPSAIPPSSLAPDFMYNVELDLSHAYTTVFMVAVVLVVLTFIPAAFLPKKPAESPLVEV
ncbi:DHA2 family efflux MFS transporter permease subunit [Mycobacterium sp. 2YAF39]|uniref:DHA2 family efflux MFS transporter permease subunit n=1 Tax=Mycobacterium sp. 2YAF39 TaxID=3233033 RepID=UPI003F958F68